MNHDNEHTADDNGDGENSRDEGENDALPHAIQSEFGDDDPNDYEPDTDTHPKPSFAIRFTRLLWRRITWRRIGDRPSHLREWVNILLTMVIAGATVTQALIYFRQADIMERALDEAGNQSILNKGSLAVSSRSVGIAEKANEGADRRFQLEERAYMVARNAHNEISDVEPNGSGHTEAAIDNLGKSIAYDQRSYAHVDLIEFPTRPKSPDALDPEIDRRFAKSLAEFNSLDSANKLPKRDVVPGQPGNVNAALNGPLAPEEAIKIITGKSYLTFFAIIRYKTEGKVRTTEYCEFLLTPTQSLASKGTWNMKFMLCKDHNTVE